MREMLFLWGLVTILLLCTWANQDITKRDKALRVLVFVLLQLFALSAVENIVVGASIETDYLMRSVQKAVALIDAGKVPTLRKTLAKYHSRELRQHPAAEIGHQLHALYESLCEAERNGQADMNRGTVSTNSISSTSDHE